MTRHPSSRAALVALVGVMFLGSAQANTAVKAPEPARPASAAAVAQADEPGLPFTKPQGWAILAAGLAAMGLAAARRRSF